MSITKMTLLEQSTALRNKEFSSVELTQAYIEKIEKEDERIGAYLWHDPELSLDAARLADELLSKDGCSPLTGIPFILKDNICTKGIPTTAASKMLKDFVPPYDATCARELFEKGAVLLGKGNMDEFGMGSACENSAFQITRNPLDMSRTPGGSSGGCAAALCANMASFALGSDTGGSVRQPCAFTGNVGMKPTYGAVSRYGLIAFASSLDVIGPMTRTVFDNAVVFSAIAKKDPMDATSRDFDFSISDRKKSIKGVRIGIADSFFTEGIDGCIKEAVLKAAKRFEDLGATIVPVALPDPEIATSAYYIISSAEASSNLSRYDGIRYGHRSEKPCTSLEEFYTNNRNEGFGDEVKRRIMSGTFVLSEGYLDHYYKKAVAVRNSVRQGFDEAFKKCDVILAPATPDIPSPLGEKAKDPTVMYAQDICTTPASIAGIPALSMPTGEKKSGLPIGMQLMGPRFSEELIYSLGIAYEEVTK